MRVVDTFPYRGLFSQKLKSSVLPDKENIVEWSIELLMEHPRLLEKYKAPTFTIGNKLAALLQLCVQWTNASELSCHLFVLVYRPNR